MKTRQNLLCPWIKQRFLDMIPKIQSIKEKNGKQNFIKIKTFCFLNTSKGMKNNPQTGRKYLPTICLIKDLYLGYIKYVLSKQ